MREDRLAEKLLAASATRDKRDVGKLIASIDATLFDRQLSFDHDKARRKAALCTRRAGKTDLIPKRLFKRALARPESIRIYHAITRLRAKELIWRQLQLIDNRFRIGAKFNETLATVTLPNFAVIRLRGSDDIAEAEKGRGDKLDEVDIDEAQLFPAEVLKNLIDDVYGPSLEDTRPQGELNVYGTPGVVCAGKWFDMTRPDAEAREPGWSVHCWGVLDNPFMAHMKERLPELKAERGWADDNPTYLREWRGLWVRDNSALFYKFDPLRNEHTFPESHFLGREWEHVLGWDIGLNDEMALVVWAFHPHERELYEAFSWGKSGHTFKGAGADTVSGWREALVDEVVGVVRGLEARGFRFSGMVADQGGMGAFVVEQVRKRHGLPFEAAKKTDKYGHVLLFNDELLAGRIKLRRGSAYAQEIAVLPKDPDGNPLKPPAEDPRFPNHKSDAGLYGWRKAAHWLYEPEAPPKPKPGTEEWHVRQQELTRRQLEAEMDAELAELAQRKRDAAENEVEGWL